jgi:hypothetical protein
LTALDLELYQIALWVAQGMVCVAVDGYLFYVQVQGIRLLLQDFYRLVVIDSIDVDYYEF